MIDPRWVGGRHAPLHAGLCHRQVVEFSLCDRPGLEKPGAFSRPPEGWLVPDTEYQVSVAVKTGSGNITVVESFFSTASE